MRNYILGGAQLGLGYGFYEKNLESTDLEIETLLEYAHSIGINEIDNAQSYVGVYEKLQCQKDANSFDINTKINYSKDSEEKIKQDLVLSLQKIGKLRFSTVYIHNWFNLNQVQRIGALKFLGQLRNLSITNSIGVSVYETSELIDELEDIDCIQAPLNFFNSSFLHSSKAIMLQKCGVNFQTRSIFHQGTLIKPELISGIFPHEASRFENYCRENQFNYLEGALSVYDNQDLFNSLVIGVTSESQLKEIHQVPCITGVLVQNWQNFKVSEELIDPRRWK